jgi:DNA-binding CsgD family transcriptional regulator
MIQDYLPLPSYYQGVEQAIQTKIEQLRAVENDIPAVIIVHDIRDSSVVYMSQRGLDNLGITMEEMRKIGTQYHDRFFNPEDAKDYVPKILGLLERNNNEEIISFFQQVRPSEDVDWSWHLSSTKILMRDKEGKPLLTITTAIPVDPKHHLTTKVERLLHENNFLRRNKQVFAGLTKREKEILRLMALGFNSGEIAEKLFISETTALTHRRNIKKKLNAQSSYDITKFAQAFDLI